MVCINAEAWSVYSLIKEDLNRYGLQVVKGDTLAEKLIVSL